VQLDPTNHRILFKLALIYQKKGDWAKLASTAAKAEKVAPTFANYSFLRGYALRMAAEKGPTTWADAKEPLMAAIQKDPNIADAYFELGEVLLHLDDEAGALANWTKAIETRPDNIQFYGALADLYSRRGLYDQAEQVAKEALAFAKPGDRMLFQVHSLLGSVKEMKGDMAGSIAAYEAAKQACGQCSDTAKGEAIVFFNLGAAYALANPPRKTEAVQQLTSFHKMVCKGALAVRYADQCAQAQELARKSGGQL
jgi:tetratricopeptide (TPR) repeat protein